MENQKLYHQYLQDFQDQKNKQLTNKLFIKKQSAELQTKVYFETVFGSKIDKSEEILNERERILNEKPVELTVEEAQDIAKCRKNVEQNKHHYIGYIMSQGFKFLNYQDNSHGDSFLHITCRNGLFETAEELLKYNANPDMKNHLGYYPIHECWMFWENDTNFRTKEQRLEQEEKTCRTLLVMLSYGAFVDAQDLNKDTVLHKVCRVGPVRAVKLLLTFYADINIKNCYGQTPLDVAKEFHQEEAYRLLNSWRNIKRFFVQADFHIVWHKFLQDPTAVINDHKSAQSILAELDLEVNSKRMKLLSNDHNHSVTIDDPLLQYAFEVTRKEHQTKMNVPKPWEQGWKKFVKMSKAAGVIDLKTRMETLKGKLKGNQLQMQATYLEQLNGTDFDEMDHSVSNLLDLRKRVPLPERPTPLTWEQQQNGERILSKKYNRLDFLDHLTKNKESDNDSVSLQSKFKEPVSTLAKRRSHYAQAVALDAKFLKFTNRLSTQSVLGIPLRTPQAPWDKTEEEGSILRSIVSQGVEYEKFEKYKKKDKLDELLGIERSPKKNSLGAYSEEVEMANFTERDKLFDSLSKQQISSITTGKQIQKDTKIEIEKKSKLDLVNDLRPRYVPADLLPLKHESSRLENMIMSQNTRNKDEAMKKHRLNSINDLNNARQALENAIQVSQQSESLSGETTQDGSRPTSKSTTRAEADKQRHVQRLFLQKPEIRYGTGRISSTHNSKGKIEEPWSIIRGRYQTVPGDRTA